MGHDRPSWDKDDYYGWCDVPPFIDVDRNNEWWTRHLRVLQGDRISRAVPNHRVDAGGKRYRGLRHGGDRSRLGESHPLLLCLCCAVVPAASKPCSFLSQNQETLVR